MSDKKDEAVRKAVCKSNAVIADCMEIVITSHVQTNNQRLVTRLERLAQAINVLLSSNWESKFRTARKIWIEPLTADNDEAAIKVLKFFSEQCETIQPSKTIMHPSYDLNEFIRVAEKYRPRANAAVHRRSNPVRNGGETHHDRNEPLRFSRANPTQSDHVANRGSAEESPLDATKTADSPGARAHKSEQSPREVELSPSENVATEDFGPRGTQPTSPKEALASSTEKSPNPIEATPPASPPPAPEASSPPVEAKKAPASPAPSTPAPPELPEKVTDKPEPPTVEPFETGAEFEKRVVSKLEEMRSSTPKERHATRTQKDWRKALDVESLVSLPESGRKLRAVSGQRPPLLRGFPSDSEPNLIHLIGDVHGDLLALEAAIECVRRDTVEVADRQESKIKSAVILLGDLIDDGPEGNLVLERVMDWAIDRPGEILLIPGNHDLALEFTEEGGFAASVSPCEFADWLNDPEGDATSTDKDIAKNFIDYCQNHGPAAIVLPHDRTLAVHGGVPHVELWAPLMAWYSGDEKSMGMTAESLAGKVSDDFAWGRIHSKAKRKFSDPSSRSQEIGVLDVQQSLSVLGELLGGLHPTRIIRGHDHKEDRYEVPKKHQNRVITINTMSYRQGRERIGPLTRQPVVARWHRPAGGQDPSLTLLQIKLRPEFVMQNAPELLERQQSTSGGDDD